MVWGHEESSFCQVGGDLEGAEAERVKVDRNNRNLFKIYWCEMGGNSEMWHSGDLSSGSIRKQLVSFMEKRWHARLQRVRIVWQITVMVCVLVWTPAVFSQQTLGPRRLSSNDTSSIRSYQCPRHRGDFECSQALENVNVWGEKVSHSPPSPPPLPSHHGPGVHYPN